MWVSFWECVCSIDKMVNCFRTFVLANRKTAVCVLQDTHMKLQWVFYRTNTWNSTLQFLLQLLTHVLWNLVSFFFKTLHTIHQTAPPLGPLCPWFIRLYYATSDLKWDLTSGLALKDTANPPLILTGSESYRKLFTEKTCVCVLPKKGLHVCDGSSLGKH